ncbi:hypothetical protein HF086_013857 [Spodoptera exigua]|uniref:Lysosomal Pro-X carboxypeptidase n=1 Tax=Spodoptera exigua TaxID=7107 RepID=A0A922SG19_SPOEX|nr:hypothetical protein HF086_013857 [Spodoptera exigua]
MFQTILYIVVSIVIVQAEYKFETKWFRVPLDHFGFQRNETFEIKYLVNDDNWDQGSGPIFFYTGNEGQIEVFAKHTGFMWEIAREYRAKLVFAEHRQFSLTANGSEALRKAFNLCTPVKNATDLEVLMEFLQSMYSSLAMVNYPFASDFLTSLPAEPVRVVCQYLNQTLTGDKLLAACTEMVMPICADGVNDMFEPEPWNFTKFADACHKKYNVYPRVEMARLEYGGNRLQASSNIVFSNGLRDPWTGGGILDSLNDSVRAVVIVDAAHHLDLMPSNPSDPEPVKIARNIHKQHISRWIQEFKEQLATTRRF